MALGPTTIRFRELSPAHTSFADAAEAREEAGSFVDVVTEDADPPYTPFDAEEAGLELGDAAYCFLRQYEETPAAVTYATVGCYWAVGAVVFRVTRVRQYDRRTPQDSSRE